MAPRATLVLLLALAAAAGASAAFRPSSFNAGLLRESVLDHVASWKSGGASASSNKVGLVVVRGRGGVWGSCGAGRLGG
jgi:hypothetical protein